MNELIEKVAIVTGASSEIGRAIGGAARSGWSHRRGELWEERRQGESSCCRD